MTITEGSRLPDARLMRIGQNGPEQVSLGELLSGRKVIIFAVPGAFTATCHSAHVPSFIRTRDRLAEKGVDEIICVAVNDPHVMKAWGEATGATAAGITMLSDADGSYTTGIGMAFDAPPAGLFGRSQRYAMVVEDGTVKALNMETQRGVCDLTGGEAMLDRL